jgi:arginase
MDLGADRRGVDMGPSAVRATLLGERLRAMGCDVLDRGDIEVPIPEASEIGDPDLKYAAAIADVCGRLEAAVRESLDDDRLPVVLGGDHSLAMGSVAGVAGHYRARGEKAGLVWFDAHGDMNVPSSTPSGNVHGMGLAHILGRGDGQLAGIGGWRGKVEAGNVCLVGSRDFDREERDLVTRAGIHVFTMKEIDRFGAAEVFEKAVGLAAEGTAGIHVSWDIDVVDPSFAPGVGTPRRGGLTYREAHLFMELIADRSLLTSVDMVEINPILDSHNATAELAAELVLSALGKRIL